MTHPRRFRALILGVLLPLVAAGCSGLRTLSDPTLVVETNGGRELGVATDWGVVFLGRTARSGPARVTAWFGDGPSLERTVIEPIGPELCTVEAPIRLPDVPIDFRDPRPGETLLVFGRDARGPWSESVTVVEDPRVLGLLTTLPARLAQGADQVGAGVYSIPVGGDTRTKRLVGLAAGTIRLRTTAGEREYLAVVGPQELWRLVTARRDAGARRPWIYRDDVL
ncbi:MAG: hypothetical protein JNK02_09580 [Planctomycetes bacterium]|nr:hypothetical protein [Planctomycetota bacterium]